MSTYKEKLDSWYAKNTFMPRHQPAKSPQLTEEEVEEWKLKNAGNFLTYLKSGTSLLKSNCGKLLMCYQQGTCKRVDETNFDRNLQRKAYDFTV